ncbi:MAG: Lrp/AsnC family transcriptional regulator [Leucobacter sp.]
MDRKIVEELQSNGRITNAELAERVGVAASTCIARVRSLVSRRIITGFTATVDPRAMGFGLEVLVSVTVRSGARQRISELSDELRSLPEVMQLFFLGGVEDFIIHLAVRDSDHVRDFVVEHLSAHPAVSSTRTSIVFSHHQNPVRVER